MSNIDRFGVFLPSYIWANDGRERAAGIREFARVVEDLGFDSLFITDHLLAARQFYSVAWLEPLTTLAVVAGVTERVRLGTSILIMPLRNPVLLAKQLATHQFLSQDRVILGAGVGWYGPEFEAVGVHKKDRGARTDEMLDIIVPLLDGETVTYKGKFYDIEDITIEPRATQRPSVWIGGGSQLADPKSPEGSGLVERVKARILRSEGWIARPTCPPEEIGRDLRELQGYLLANGRDPAGLVVAHENFMHVVPTTDGTRARLDQHEAYSRIMSDERGQAYLESVYLFGTPDELITSLQARIDAGVDYFLLHTLTPDPAQLHAWMTLVIPNLVFPDTAAGDPLAAPVGHLSIR